MTKTAGAGSISQRRGSGSVPKCHGSAPRTRNTALSRLQGLIQIRSYEWINENLCWLILAATRLAELEIGLAESRAESSHLHEMVSLLGELHLSLPVSCTWSHVIRIWVQVGFLPNPDVDQVSGSLWPKTTEMDGIWEREKKLRSKYAI